MDSDWREPIDQRELDALTAEAGKQRLIFERNELLTAVREKISKEAQIKKERQ